MFKPLAMQHISLKVLSEDVPLTAQVLAECGLFHPEASDVFAEHLPERLGETFHQIFSIAHSRFNKILARFPIIQSPLTYRTVSLSELEQVNQQLGDIWQAISQLEEKLHQHHEQQTYFKQLLETLKIFSGLDVDLKLFQKSTHFLNLHIGTVSVDTLEHLEEAMALASHFLTIFQRNEQSVSFVVAGPLEHQDKVRAILEHADFQALNIPPEFHKHPQQVHADLTAHLVLLQKHIEKVKVTIQALSEKHKLSLVQASHILNNAAAYAELSKNLRGRGHLALIEGWMPTYKVSQLEDELSQQLKSPFVLNTRTPAASEYAHVPSLIRHHRLFAPFMTLVKNYGTPRYGEFDPTLLFTVTFLLMFGTMFGDVGHGALIAGAGWYWRDTLKTFTPFFITAGLSSMFFGFLYGSIFGYEEVLLPALWISPIHNPNIMLKVALYWGIGFILLATLLTVMNRWHAGEYADALFNNTGISGILLYLGGFYAAQQWMLYDIFEYDQQLAVLLPLFIILGYKWIINKLSFGERFLVTLIEGLESVINYLANTLSFLRVAAFSLNHAALAIAVFTLANMIDNPAHWLVIILGNLFIVIVEGAIVTIQVLRLEYYEGFSRFFSGDGRAFHPLTIGLHQK